MQTWQPASKDEVEKILEQQLKKCSDEQKTYFETIRVDLYPVKIFRYGPVEEVYVVAEKNSDVIYFEDVEDGFNISTINDKNELLKNGFEQFEIGHVLFQCINNLNSFGNSKEISESA